MVLIRSQNKEELVETRHIYIIDFDDYCLVCCESEFGSNQIGKYSTKEKALKVLDMIQEHICNKIGMYFHLNKGYGDGYECTEPFEIPQDDEVEV